MPFHILTSCLIVNSNSPWMLYPYGLSDIFFLQGLWCAQQCSGDKVVHPFLISRLLQTIMQDFCCHGQHIMPHYNDVIMGAIASQITSLTIVYSTVYSGTDQRKHQSSTTLAFVRWIHQGPVNSPHKWPVTRKHYDDVIITTQESQITSLAIVYSIVYSDADQRKHQSSASLAFVRWIHRVVPHCGDCAWVPVALVGNLCGGSVTAVSDIYSDISLA